MAHPATAEHETLTWELFGTASRELALAMPVVLPPVPEPVNLAGTRVLVADDVADTGATLALAKDYCTQHVAEVRCAVVYEKPRSRVHGEYVWRRTDRWIDFPWSVDRPGTANQDA